MTSSVTPRPARVRASKGTLGAFQAVLFRRAPLDEVVSSGSLSVVTGDASELLDMFLPPEAAHKPLPGMVGGAH